MEGTGPTVVVYWRRHCPYCASLRRALRHAGLPTVEHDIWAEPEAAAFVRRVAGGNETVPTVVVDDEVFVNPSARTVLEAAGHPVPPGLLDRLRSLRRGT